MLKRNRLHVALTALLALSAAGSAFGQNTSAAVAGRVVDAAGAPVAGATVEIVHGPSGSRTTVTTDAEGRYISRGLRVGGPYTIEVDTAGGDAEQEQVFLLLAETSTVNLTLGPDAATDTAELEAVTVTASASAMTFSSDNQGASTNVTREQIEAFPSIKRSIEDYVRFDPRIVQVDKERGGISAGGQNNRYNNIKIDGVPTNDQFGLNDSGVPALNQPISIDWIEEFNIGVSNYDVTQTDFVGVNINAVTKSGGNEFAGAVYGTYRDSDMVGDDENGNEFSGFDDEWTAGAYVSGPIIQDVLYFFVGYEEFKRTSPGATNGVAGSGFTRELNITQAQLDEIRTIAAGYGLPDIGGQASGIDNTDEKVFGKLDWNINEDHRATFRYNKTEGEVARLNTSDNTLQLDSNYYADNISFENFAALLYSNWSDIFSTEANVSYSEYRSLPQAFSLFPQIRVNVANSGGQGVLFGRERSRHANELAVDTWTAFAAGDFFLGDHTVRVGFDYEDNDVFNLFLQDVYGNYTFANIDQFRAGNWQNYSLQRPANGDLNSVAANFGVQNTGVFVQDTWSVNANLTLQYGFRVDKLGVENTPPFNQAAFNAFGYDNRSTPDGETSFQPRLGFNYQFDTERQTQLRGGVGLFQGSAPGVWISNSFSNPGGLAIAYSAQNGSGVNFDPNNPFIPATTNAAQLVNFLAPDFQQPTVWKANLALEHELPWWGVIAGAEVLFSEAEDAVKFTHLNLGDPTGLLPDGRYSYYANNNPASFNNNGSPGNRQNRNRNFTDIILLENTDKGKAHQLTLSLEKPFEDGLFAKVGYTYSKAEEVSPGTSSVAFSNWSNRLIFNPNEEVLSTSNYEIRDRFTAQISKYWKFWGDNKTTVAMFYEGREGRPYSYRFNNDANGDGFGTNDLFFVPVLANAQYSTNSTPQDIEAFIDYIESNDSLNDQQGRVVDRNDENGPWVHQFDVRLAQEIPFFADTRGELYLDILNIGNMINDEWGHIEEAAFPYGLGVARFAGVSNGNYVYDVSNYVNETTGVVNNPSLIRKDVAGESRWAVQVGFRFEF